MPKLMARTKTQFLRILRDEDPEICKRKMMQSNGRMVLDRIANDQEFADLVDTYRDELPAAAEDWKLTAQEGGQ